MYSAMKAGGNHGKGQHGQGLNGLYDLFPSLASKDYQAAIAELQKLQAWLQGLAMSRLEYVDMGFDTLKRSTVTKIANQAQHMTENYQPIHLPPKSKKGDLVPINQVYQEQFPFWTPPY